MMILNEYNLLFELKQNVSYEEFSTPLNDEDYSVIEEKLFDRLNGTGDLQFKKSVDRRFDFWRIYTDG